MAKEGRDGGSTETEEKDSASVWCESCERAVSEAECACGANVCDRCYDDCEVC